MAWTIEFTKNADKQLSKLDHQSRKSIQEYLEYRITKLDHPTSVGKALEGDMRGLWRYRVNKLRIVCRIENNELLVLVLEIALRDKIYK